MDARRQSFIRMIIIGKIELLKGEERQKCFKILMRYGWSYEREEADLVYGNHELYKKES